MWQRRRSSFRPRFGSTWANFTQFPWRRSCASLVLIDERKGRRAANEFGVKAIGTLSMLELAAERRLLELDPSLQALRQTTFYISDEYLEAALQRDIARRRT